MNLIISYSLIVCIIGRDKIALIVSLECTEFVSTASGAAVLIIGTNLKSSKFHRHYQDHIGSCAVYITLFKQV